MALQFPGINDVLADFFKTLEDDNSRLAKAPKMSLVYGIAKGVSAVVSRCYSRLSDLYTGFFVSRSSGDQLVARLEDSKLYPFKGDRAYGGVMVSSPTGVSMSIAAGDILFGEDTTIRFEVLQGTTFGATPVHLPIIAQVVGQKCNLEAGTPLYSSNPGLTGAKFQVSFNTPVNGKPSGRLQGGKNPETDQELKTRYASHWKGMARGVEFAVEAALKNIPTIQIAEIKNATPAPGYFTVILANSPAELGDGLRDSIEAVLAEYASLGFGYVIDSLTQRVVNIEVELRVDPEYDRSVGLSIYEDRAMSALSDSISKLKQGQALNLTEIIRAVKVAGVSDVTVVTPTANVNALPSEIITAGEVNIHARYQ